jgi:SAM-dependent methyltransferase
VSSTAQAAADAATRGAPVDELLLAALGADIAAATVLDCGGGTGRFAVPLAVAGARVTVVDVSVDALATLLRRADEAGVAERVRAVQGEVEALDPAIGGEQFDLVLAHGVLDALDDLAVGFAAIVAATRPGGLVSLLVDNPAAAVLTRALAGELEAAEREVAALGDERGPAGGATPQTVARLCAAHGLALEQQHGIGIFRDLVPGRVLDHPGARESLLRLEAACAQRSPFAQIAARVHLLARRPASG